VPGDRTERQILRGSQETGKTYQFDEEHDENQPAQMWFQESHEGEILFVVFYSQACRWSRCLGCNLPSKSSQHHVGYRPLMAQIDHVFAEPSVLDRRKTIGKVILSNNGSMLDEETFSSTALVYLLAKINLHLPKVAVLTLETRPEYVDLAELEIMSRVVKEGDTPTQLELAIGFEAFDERIRNDVFRKGLGLGAFERLVRDVAPFGFRLKCYVMQKPVPGMTDEEAIEDVRSAIDFMHRAAEESGVRIDVHLNPTYVGGGTPLAEAFARGEYTPPRLVDVARAVRHAKGKSVSVFVGLYDEGLAVEGGSFIRPGEQDIAERLELFNRTQDFAVLDGIGPR
jgi:radical SAM enzyme (TIGR01210 family)